MTRITGSIIITCPECGKEYATPKYGSINLGALEEWSDAFFYAGLFYSRPSVCKCDCGALFLQAKALTHGFAQLTEMAPMRNTGVEMPDIPAFLRKEPGEDIPWWRTLWRDFTRSPKPEIEKNPSRDLKIEENQKLRCPEVSYIEPADVEAVLARSFAAAELEIAVRRDCWWGRGHWRRWSTAAPEQLLPLDELETDNLRKLLALLLSQLESHPQDDADGSDSADLEGRRSTCWMEIGEIQRELGLFDESVASFARVGDSHSSKARKLIQVARKHQTYLVKFDSEA